MFPKIKRNDSETQMKIAYYPLKIRRMQDTENIFLKRMQNKTYASNDINKPQNALWLFRNDNINKLNI